jgi:hypothetical protein
LVGSWCESGEDLKKCKEVDGYRGSMWWYPQSDLEYAEGMLETNVALYKYFM